TENFNFIKSYSPQRQIPSDGKLYDLLDIEDSVSVTTQYFDGLGRGLQSVSKASSPNRKDIISYSEYDAFGREAVKYLPFAGQTRTGFNHLQAKTEQQAFYQSATTA